MKLLNSFVKNGKGSRNLFLMVLNIQNKGNAVSQFKTDIKHSMCIQHNHLAGKRPVRDFILYIAGVFHSSIGNPSARYRVKIEFLPLSISVYHIFPSTVLPSPLLTHFRAFACEGVYSVFLKSMLFISREPLCLC